MTRRTRWILTGAAAAAVVTGLGGAAVASTVADSEKPITGAAYERASSAALDHLGSGRVTETEDGDEDSRYEVEVTLPDGRQVDVQLDERFTVVGSSSDEEHPDQHPDEAGSNDG